MVDSLVTKMRGGSLQVMAKRKSEVKKPEVADLVARYLRAREAGKRAYQRAMNPKADVLAPNTSLVRQFLEAADKAGYKLELWCE